MNRLTQHLPDLAPWHQLPEVHAVELYEETLMVEHTTIAKIRTAVDLETGMSTYCFLTPPPRWWERAAEKPSGRIVACPECGRNADLRFKDQQFECPCGATWSELL
jgi:hypothetical protein